MNREEKVFTFSSRGANYLPIFQDDIVKSTETPLTVLQRQQFQRYLECRLWDQDVAGMVRFQRMTELFGGLSQSLRKACHHPVGHTFPNSELNDVPSPPLPGGIWEALLANPQRVWNLKEIVNFSIFPPYVFKWTSSGEPKQTELQRMAWLWHSATLTKSLWGCVSYWISLCSRKSQKLEYEPTTIW